MNIGTNNTLSVPTNPATAQAPPPTTNCAWKKCVDDLGNEALERLAEWRGISLALWLKLKQLLLVGLFQGRIAFPVMNRPGEVIACHHRRIAGQADWLVTPFVDGKIQMFPFAVNEPQTKSCVFAFESQWDMLAFLDKAEWQNAEIPEYGFVATRSAANGKRVAEVCRADATIVAIPQNDQPGRVWLSRVAKACRGKVLQVKIPPLHKDLNDWTRSGAKWEDIDNALNDPEVLREPLPQGDVTNGGQEGDSDTSEDGECAYDGVAPATTTKDGRVWVHLPGKNRLISQFAADMGRTLADTVLYNRHGLPFIVEPTTRNFKEMTAQSFRTWAEQYVVCCLLETPEEGPPSRLRKSMSVTDAAAVLASHQFLGRLRSIRNLNQVRLPVVRQCGKIELLPVGFDAESRAFTFETPGLDYPKPMTIGEAKNVINGLFQEFCFRDDGGRSLSVAIAGMMTPFAFNLLPEGTDLPCFIVMANAEGAGKTLLVKIQVVPVFGSFAASSKPTNEEEMSKLLLAAVIEGRRYIVFDNIKEHLDSASLEGFLTSPTWSGRILGSSKTFDSGKNTVVFATGNACTVSPDMRRRSLFVELFMKEERAEERRFSRTMDVSYLLQNRAPILNALWAFVQHWDTNGRPASTLSHSSFPEWAKVIAGIVESAGYSSPITPPRIDCAADLDGNAMRTLVDALPAGTPQQVFTFQQFVEYARQVGAFEQVIGSEGELDRKMKTTFSRVLKRYDRRSIRDYVFLLQGQGHARHYVFKKPELVTTMPPELVE